MVNASLSLKIYKRDNYICQYCAKEGLESFDSWCSMTIDHYNGDDKDNREENLKTACSFCNSRKHDDQSADIEKIRASLVEKKIKEIEKFYAIRKEVRK